MMRGDEENRDPAARLDALWEATRPVEPSAEAWDQVWTAVADGLDRRATTPPARSTVIRREGMFIHQPASAHARRPMAVAAAAVAVMLAQAAAILLVVGLSWREADPQSIAVDHGQVATADVRIEEGQLVMIQSNADTVQTIDLSAQLGVGGVDAWYSLHNQMEATNIPVVAWSE